MVDSTYIMLIPPNPSPHGSIEMMNMTDFVESISGMNTKSRTPVRNCFTQTINVERKNAATDPIKLNTRETKTQTKRKMRDVACNVKAETTNSSTITNRIKTKMVNVGVNTAPVKRSSVVLPVQRSSSTPISNKTTAPNKISLESYKQMRKRELSECSGSVNSLLKNPGLKEFKEQMEYLQSHLKRLKNMMESVIEDMELFNTSGPSKLMSLTGKYVDHILHLNKKFYEQSPTLVMSQDKIVMAAVFEDHPLWHFSLQQSGNSETNSIRESRARAKSMPRNSKKSTDYGKENHMKRRIDLPTGVACPNVRSREEDDKRTSATKRRRVEETRNSDPKYGDYSIDNPRSSRYCGTPSSYRQERYNLQCPDRPRTAHSASRSDSWSSRESREADSRRSVRYPRSPSYSRANSKSPRRYHSSMSRRSPTPTRNQMLSREMLTGDQCKPIARMPSPVAFLPKPCCTSKFSRKSPISPSSSPQSELHDHQFCDGAINKNCLLPTPDVSPSASNADEHHPSNKEMSVETQTQKVPTSDHPNSQKVYPKISTLKDDPIASISNVSSIFPSNESITVEDHDSDNELLDESIPDSRTSPCPETNEVHFEKPSDDLLHPSTSCQTSLSPTKGSDQPTSPHPMPDPEVDQSTSKCIKTKKRIKPHLRRKKFNPNYNAHFSHISTQITRREDHHGNHFPYSHQMQGGLMSRNTGSYYPPNLTSFLSAASQFHLQRYNNHSRQNWPHY